MDVLFKIAKWCHGNVCGALLTLIFASSAWAAEIEVAHVESYTFVTISGELVLEDGEKFARAVRSLPGAIIVLNSPGGNLFAGLRIGALAHQRGFATLVPEGATCASACAIAWVGGRKRFLAKHSLLGFHAAYKVKNGDAVESGAGNAILGAYLNQLGLSFAAIYAITHAGPENMTWLDANEAKAIGIDAVEIDGSTNPALEATNVAVLPLRDSEKLTNDQRARIFLDDFLASNSNDSRTAISFTQSVVAEYVDYYGTRVSKASVIRDKSAFVKRWPERLYVLRPASVAVHCPENSSTCTVSASVDFECRSYLDGRHSKGVSLFTLHLNFVNGSVSLVGETSKVVQRK